MENLKIPGGLLVGYTFTRSQKILPEWHMAMVTQNWPVGTNLTYFTTLDMETGAARQSIAEKAVELGTKYVFFVDTDTAPPVFAARKLIYELEQHDEAMACAGIYCTKEDPPYPIVFKDLGQGVSWDWLVGDVFECAGVGTGCMMIKTEVFSKLSKPWFQTVDIEPTDTHNFSNKQTDDLYFCRKVTEAGYKILAHGGVIPIHWDAETARPFMLPSGCKPLREYEASQREGITLTEYRMRAAQKKQEAELIPGD